MKDENRFILYNYPDSVIQVHTNNLIVYAYIPFTQIFSSSLSSEGITE